MLAEYWENNDGSASPDMEWDAFKAYVWGKYILATAAIRKKQKANTRVLQMQKELQRENYSLDPNTTIFNIMMAVQRDLHIHMVEITVP